MNQEQADRNANHDEVVRLKQVNADLLNQISNLKIQVILGNGYITNVNGADLDKHVELIRKEERNRIVKHLKEREWRFNSCQSCGKNIRINVVVDSLAKHIQTFI